MEGKVRRDSRAPAAVRAIIAFRFKRPAPSFRRSKPIDEAALATETLLHFRSSQIHLAAIRGVTPEEHAFAGDKEANHYLDRERRKPWFAPEKI